MPSSTITHVRVKASASTATTTMAAQRPNIVFMDIAIGETPAGRIKIV
jgi:hypothetical protein